MVKLLEHQGKDMFDRFGIKTPRRKLVRSAAQAGRAAHSLHAGHVVLKAQVRTGKRGKAGAVRIVEAKDAVRMASAILRTRVHGLLPESMLVEEQEKIIEGMYLSVTIDAAKRCLVVILSKKGGADVEDIARDNPRSIIKDSVVPGTGAVPPKIQETICTMPKPAQLSRTIRALIALANAKDATLVEINPLALTNKGYVALDAKIVIDDNAIARHPDLQGITESLPAVEKAAKKAGLHYVDLDGDIAVIGNGAGLVMATLDLIADCGARPANFLDLQGGTGAKQVELAMRLCMAKRGIRSMFVNIFAGITDCDEIAQGLITFKRKHGIRKPVIVRMVGTHEKSATALLGQHGFLLATGMEAGVRMVIKEARR